MWSWLWWTKEVAWPARFRWRSFEVRYCQVSCTPENWVVVSFFCDPYLGKWSNSTNIFQMGWSHQLDYVQSIHVLLWMILSLSLSPAPSPWFWSLDFQNCHRGSGIGVVTCLKYHHIMTKPWKSHTLIPMLTPGCSRLANLQQKSQRDPGKLLKTPTRWRNNCNKLHKKLRLLSKHVRHSCWSSFGFVVTSKKSLDVGDRLRASCLQIWRSGS